MTLPDLDTSTRIALRRFAEEEGISLEEAVVRLVRDGLVGLGMVEEEGDYSEITEEELAASDPQADALIARSRVVSSKRL
jgi:hypothetical protein